MCKLWRVVEICRFFFLDDTFKAGGTPFTVPTHRYMCTRKSRFLDWNVYYFGLTRILLSLHIKDIRWRPHSFKSGLLYRLQYCEACKLLGVSIHNGGPVPSRLPRSLLYRALGAPTAALSSSNTRKTKRGQTNCRSSEEDQRAGAPTFRALAWCMWGGEYQLKHEGIVIPADFIELARPSKTT